MDTAHSPAKTPLDSPADDAPELICPHCAYNLRGLPTNRCPECGETFDVAEIRARQSDQPRDAIPWDHRRSIITFFKTWKLAAFSPRTLAAGFPNAHHEQNAHSYAVCSSAIALGIGLLTVAVLVANAIVLLAFVLLALAIFVGIGATERSLAAILRRCARPPGITNSADYWLGLVRYAGGFKILSVAMAAVVTVADFTPGPAYSDLDELIMFCIVAAPGVWWLAVIFAMALPRANDSIERIFAICAPFVATCIGAGVTLLLYVPTVFIAFAACNMH